VSSARYDHVIDTLAVYVATVSNVIENGSGSSVKIKKSTQNAAKSVMRAYLIRTAVDT
jgi:hypothetical protein